MTLETSFNMLYYNKNDARELRRVIHPTQQDLGRRVTDEDDNQGVLIEITQDQGFVFIRYDQDPIFLYQKLPGELFWFMPRCLMDLSKVGCLLPHVQVIFDPTEHVDKFMHRAVFNLRRHEVSELLVETFWRDVRESQTVLEFVQKTSGWIDVVWPLDLAWREVAIEEANGHSQKVEAGV